MRKIDHIGVAVRSLTEALPFYTDVLRLTLEGVDEVESEKVKVAFLRIGESRIELLEPTAPDSAIAQFIEKRGEGIHHIALGVEAIEARIAELKDGGVRMIHDVPKTGAHGAKVAFMHPKSAHGVLYELCERSE